MEEDRQQGKTQDLTPKAWTPKGLTPGTLTFEGLGRQQGKTQDLTPNGT